MQKKWKDSCNEEHQKAIQHSSNDLKETIGKVYFDLKEDLNSQLAKTLTLMNIKIDIENILVIYDDMDIEPGKIKIRKKGSSGGHNGIKSIIENLGTEEFSRIRIGIGRPTLKQDKINYVIGTIYDEEKEKLEKGVEIAVEAVEEILKNGIDSAMNKFN